MLQLVGQVRGRWVGELRRVVSEILRESGARLVLDLGEVTFVDVEGLALLRGLSARGVRLAGASLFVTQQLEGPEGPGGSR